MDKKRVSILFVFIIIFSILIILSLNYYNSKYYVSFETGTDEIFLTKYVEKNGKIEKPNTPNKIGYVFIEWQLDGKTFNFNTKIKKDIILTAKWVKEEYITIEFDTDSNNLIESKKILKGESIKELEIPIKENHEFIGWYLNGVLYNNEEIHSDVTLKALYKNDTINPLYKIGDKVIITGNYSNKANNGYIYNTKAISWEREILNYINDSEYPYVVGNNLGVTGFFKAESIERVE